MHAIERKRFTGKRLQAKSVGISLPVEFNCLLDCLCCSEHLNVNYGEWEIPTEM